MNITPLSGNVTVFYLVNEMNSDFDIRTNKYGEPDVDYYMQEAYVMRAEVVMFMVTSVFGLIKRIATAASKLDFKPQKTFGTLLGY
ncbi:hypothetical protein QKW35_20655 [Pontibacterium granulatum]|uniref:RSP_7527 family protein n=1 Tax=Pontibacterium granulatum TaxID=2036029 RepID=UPI00249AEFB6|nr:hypothetical protein [Pontibacterium granulatum]MDI3326795.1 hypothetical protein [Pontibacterium granulatum]